MKKSRFIKRLIAIVIAILWNTDIQAQKAKEFYATAGWMYLAPQSKSSTLRMISTGSSSVDVELPDTAVRLSKSNTLGFSGGYFFTDHWAAELTAGIPPEFDIKGWDVLSPLGKIAKTTAWTPILQVKYRQPIIPKLSISASVGATYCWFTNSKVVNDQLDVMLGGPTDLRVSGAFTPVFSSGLNYTITDRWFVGGNFTVIPLKVDAYLTTHNQTTNQIDKYKIKVDLNPIITYVSVGYVFKKKVKNN
ncbi:MAG: outer membrane beta-barrel protein [Chryseobacterium sp.]|jgi:outer membrane protein|uniref:OmpW/AlkL family protein n=1 Tax=Chryseobacterium sp. TaxID=1871047 RepID=UPI00282D8E31|nr:OmpW family outer membrane protein [Chryseobacterium sp.]MDR2236858.1 outer membrane beta-barrel protein [Chryseobacterium sp.]